MKPDHALSSELSKYWSEVASTFQWMKPWNKVLSGNFFDVNIKWFEGAKLNITENCLDRHLDKNRNKTALIFEPNDPKDPSTFLTYGELQISVCRFANMLKNRGIKKGDVVCLYMGMTPELLIGILACARIGPSTLSFLEAFHRNHCVEESMIPKQNF
jgi:acetyl-CoA synthetase